jgi:hypothetical protein
LIDSVLFFDLLLSCYDRCCCFCFTIYRVLSDFNLVSLHIHSFNSAKLSTYSATKRPVYLTHLSEWLGELSVASSP